jgi:hypothetical protein
MTSQIKAPAFAGPGQKEKVGIQAATRYFAKTQLVNPCEHLRWNGRAVDEFPLYICAKHGRTVRAPLNCILGVDHAGGH